mgnify:CR=1 FL=1|jgi:hypothetical protein
MKWDKKYHRCPFCNQIIEGPEKGKLNTWNHLAKECGK